MEIGWGILIILGLVGFCALYFIVKAAVRDGVIEAEQLIHPNGRKPPL